MALKGDLKSINLANVLQDLAQNELTGTLRIQAGDRARHFWFEKGKLRLVGLGNGKGPSSLNGLLALGKVRAADVVPPSKRAQQATVVRSLMKKGSVGAEEVKAALEQQMSELVCDVFVWSEATFEFTEGDPDEDVFDTGQLDWDIRLACDTMIMEALRRVDEWGEIKRSVLSPEEILVRVADRPVPEGDATTERVAAFLDGERRLRDVIDATHLGQFTVFRAAAALLRTGAARTLSVAEAFAKAKAAAAKKQPEQALRLARFGLEREPNNLELRALAGELLETLERAAEAVSEYRQLAAAQTEHGRREEAVATYRRIVALAPRDTFSHERLFQLLLELGQKAEALQQGEGLSGAYKRAGLPDKAKEVYARLIAAFGDDDELLESAAELARRLGDKKEAVSFYKKLFDRALARGDEDGVVQLSRTLLRLDPTLEDIARRRMEVETGMYRKRQQRRKRFRLVAVSAAVAGLLAFAVTHEVQARTSLQEIRKDAITLLAAHDYKTLLRKYNDFLDAYRWSVLSGPDARGFRDEAERSFAEQELPKLELAADDAQLLANFAVAQEVRALLRLKETRARAEEVFARLRDRVGAIENRFITEAQKLARERTPESIESIKQMSHPLALEALQALARHDASDIRGAAVVALGKNRSPAALETLITMLSDPELPIRSAAAAGLKEATGQDFGYEQNRWSEWLRKSEAPLAGTSLLHAVLPVSWQRVALNDRPMVEWRLVNLGAAAEEFFFDFEFEGKGPGDRTLATKANAAPRRILLRPGEYIGGASDLRMHLDGLTSAGTYRIRWVAKIQREGLGEKRIRSLEGLVEFVEPAK